MNHYYETLLLSSIATYNYRHKLSPLYNYIYNSMLSNLRYHVYT